MTSPTLRLLDWARTHGPDVLDAIGRALVVAQQAHRDEQRRSGDPYITHPIQVALILTEQDAAPETVVTAVLHDVLDARSPRPLPELRTQFGDVVADLLLDYTRLDRHPHGPGLRQADRRALQVKVADRLHNMRTIRHLTLTSQRKKAEQTRELVAPIARSLGMIELGLELDRLSSATLRSIDAATHPQTRRRAHATYPLSTNALRRTLHIGAVALPQHCRDRWRQDWEGELHACTNIHECVTFARNVLLGLPAMALQTRRTDRR